MTVAPDEKKWHLLFCDREIRSCPVSEFIDGCRPKHQVKILRFLGLLEEMGLDFDDVVKATCYLKDMDEIKAFNEDDASYMAEPYPARTTIQAARLPLDILIEIEVIAQKR